MSIIIKQFSSLENILSGEDMNKKELNEATVLKGEHFSYQVALYHKGGNIENRNMLRISVDSPIKDFVKVYAVKNVVADFPHPEINDEDYIFHTPSLFPDLLVPIDNQNGYASEVNTMSVFWVEVCVKDDYFTGNIPINFNITGFNYKTADRIETIDFEKKAVMNLNIIPFKMPQQEIKFTQWFHVDCIADAHGEDIYTERHWVLIEKYMKMAREIGINMILTPVITPPLDTAPGTSRPITQLVKIEKSEKGYIFDFSLLHRYISLAKKCGMEYYEISHFFSQWGSRFAPNIEVFENGEKKLMFGWHIKSDDLLYENFLKSFIPALLEELRKENILENCYFHISDEPSETHLLHYEYASNLLKPLLGDCRIMDALSHYEFYEKGLVDNPVCTIDYIEPFIEKKVNGLWAYYCCAQREKVSNRFIAMTRQRNRIIGFQLYKYGIEGFLHWGYNFYYSQYSFYGINPFLTTSSDGIFSSGDAFSVYPGKNGPLLSIRAFIFREALEDIAICRLLEEKIGKENVIKLIEEEAGMEITFKEYPKDTEFIIGIINKMKQML